MHGGCTWFQDPVYGVDVEYCGFGLRSSKQASQQLKRFTSGLEGKGGEGGGGRGERWLVRSQSVIARMLTPSRVFMAATGESPKNLCIMTSNSATKLLRSA